MSRTPTQSAIDFFRQEYTARGFDSIRPDSAAWEVGPFKTGVEAGLQRMMQAYDGPGAAWSAEDRQTLESLMVFIENSSNRAETKAGLAELIAQTVGAFGDARNLRGGDAFTNAALAAAAANPAEFVNGAISMVDPGAGGGGSGAGGGEGGGAGAGGGGGEVPEVPHVPEGPGGEPDGPGRMPEGPGGVPEGPGGIPGEGGAAGGAPFPEGEGD